MEAIPREVLVCQADDGSEPFSAWLDSLDSRTEAIVLERIDRVERGNFGDHDSIGEGVSDLRIDVGPGYRIYFAQLERGPSDLRRPKGAPATGYQGSERILEKP